MPVICFSIQTQTAFASPRAHVGVPICSSITDRGFPFFIMEIMVFTKFFPCDEYNHAVLIIRAFVPSRFFTAFSPSSFESP
jgi:hypothetical protein